jgi:hypothetical protein
VANHWVGGLRCLVYLIEGVTGLISWLDVNLDCGSFINRNSNTIFNRVTFRIEAEMFNV